MAEIPPIPLLIDELGAEKLELLRSRIKTDTVHKRKPRSTRYLVVFRLTDIQPADYVRAIQEIEMLKTKVMGHNKTSAGNITLASFYDLWYENSVLRKRIMHSQDPHEEKWRAAGQFKYKLATNFMPMYAKSILEHFNATSVLDPCAGWGDRMAGALSAGTVSKYVGFDPNINLRSGYKKIMHDFGKPVTYENGKSIIFDSVHAIHSECFEKGEELLQDSIFDFAFTGPPFFLYEDYGAFMPRYDNWYQDFYRPLFMITHNHLKSHGYFVVYLNDSLGGEIENYMVYTVPQFTSFRFIGKIGMIGGSSSRIRDVFVFQRGARV
jgi:hypothetical protein